MTGAREGGGRAALVTGASAGIGAELARVFASHGFNLVLTARRAERLEALAARLRAAHDVIVHCIPADLAEPETPGKLVSILAEQAIAVDVLVNNAGYGVPGFYRDTPWEVQRDFLQVLVTGPCELAHRLLPGMTRRGFGRILNVASVAGLMPGHPGHTLYGGSKALMIKFSQSLHSEQKGTGVFVTALCPGFTISEFHDVNGTRRTLRRLPGFMWLSAARVAEAGYKAVMRNDPLCLPGIPYKAISAVVRLLPLKGAHRLSELRSLRLLAKRE